MSTIEHPSTSSLATVTEAATGAVASPTSDVRIPPPPADYTPATPGEFRNLVPRQSELAALSKAVEDIGNFTDYPQVIGGTAPPYDHVAQTLVAALQWSTSRQAALKWAEYASLQEGLAWRAVRAQMRQLRPAFGLASQCNPSIVTRFQGLASLLGAMKVIAQKGASTRKANQQAEAEGRPAVHGAVGKQRQRAAEKAALAKQDEAAARAGSLPESHAPVAPDRSS
jgi:hypothetical protein